MIVARVIGEVVATRKHDSHVGMKLLRLEPEALAGVAHGAPSPLISLDAVDAGVGERVLVVLDGFAAMTAVDRAKAPIDAAVVGIVERLDLSTD